MIPCTDEEAGIVPFHQWKSEQYVKDQAAGTPHFKEWYYSAYGGYCSKKRREFVERQAAKAP